ncbi:MAG: non-canonical purine NTP pyrophosphatase [Candidatus Synoicihabitans palmerolidicus]|nr:non-canonical purine NTP pyrophosphatase [Candidatus Synoicihabitans palmerolidicus]
MTVRQVIYLASGNAHKVHELPRLADAEQLPVEIRSAREVGGMPDVVEDTGTFEGNAGKKAAALLPLLPPEAWALADDSGICVDALDGQPGVESAYFAGEDGDDDANLAKLVRVMRDVPADKRGAHYVCVLRLRATTGLDELFTGTCDGMLQVEPEGTGAFGYDPLFAPAGYGQTFGLLSPETKQALSHRAKAWNALADWIRSQTVR